jgi:hypothetical protein
METETQDLFAEPVTPELAAKHIAAVAAHHGKNEKLAWKRKVKKMMGLIDEVGVVEQEILELVLKKQPTLDEIAILRAEMTKECIHPKDHLVHLTTCLMCKFCDKRISIPRILKAESPEVDEGEDVSQ